MKTRTFLLFALIAVMLSAIVCGGAGASETGKEPAARTILPRTTWKCYRENLDIDYWRIV